jgi:hypothetical protein
MANNPQKQNKQLYVRRVDEIRVKIAEIRKTITATADAAEKAVLQSQVEALKTEVRSLKEKMFAGVPFSVDTEDSKAGSGSGEAA